MDYFDSINPITLSTGIDSIIIMKANLIERVKISLPSRYGDTSATISNKAVSLPFPSNSSYKIIQGNNGSFSHQSDYSKYALDFNLQTGDTICAIADGFVVGVIEDYSSSGITSKWRDYANIITLFHPYMNLFSQYVHLDYKGSLVELGQSVQEGEPIGISGLTGFTKGEHLHLGLSKPTHSQDGLISIPITFKEGYEGAKLKKGDIVKK